MEWRLTERDAWWLAVLPAAAALLLGWFWTRPLAAEALAESRERAALGSAGDLRARIDAANARAAAERKRLEETRERLALAESDATEVLPPAAPPDILRRLALVSGLCRQCGVQILSSSRTDADRSGSLGHDGLPLDPLAEYWVFKVRASMEEAAALLRAVEAAPATTLVDSLALEGIPLPREKHDWTMTMWL